jgi:hypothetical protein
VKTVALIYLLLIGFLTVQPLLALQQSKQVNTCCKKESCSKNDKEPKKDTDCRNKSCNPFIACAYGNFYFLSNSRIDFGNLPLNKQKTYSYNDNRLSANPSECWHPPQV